MRGAIGGGQPGRLADAHAPAVDPPPAAADQERALLAHQPGAELAALEDEPGPLQELALAMADEVAEQAERHGLGPAVRVAPAGAARASPIATTWRAPRRACSQGIAQACAKHRAAAGKVSGSIAISSAPGATNATQIQQVHAVQRRPSRRSVRSLASSRQCSRAASSRPPRAIARGRLDRSAARDRAPHHHQLGVQRQLADHLGGTVGVRHGGDHPQVELAAKRRHRRLGLGVAGVPAARVV